MVTVDRADPVGVVGAGTMGAGIAHVAAVAGHEVLLLDSAADVAAHAVESVGDRMERLAAKGRLRADEAAAARRRLTAVADPGDLAACALVVEAVAEDLAVKRDLFADLEKVCDETAILATNTSSLSVTEIAAGLARPERVAGMHFFNPAPVLPLVEIVVGAATDAAVADALVGLARAWGKTPVRCTSTPGFIVNRVARPYYAEAFRLLEADVTDPATLDALFREAGGFPMGPCELTDMIGQDVNAAVTRSLWAAFGRDARFEPSAYQAALVADGRLGRKTGRGIYDGGPRPEPSTAPAAPRPEQLTVNGAGGPLDGLVRRMAAAGLTGPATFDLGPVRIRPAPDVVIRLTDGRTAAAVSAAEAQTVVLVDLALDYATASRVAVAAPEAAPAHAVRAATGCLQAAGLAVTPLPDTPGLIVARTVAMLAAFGADAVDAGVASAADVDTAMRLGVNHPRGPLEWGDALGWDWVVSVIDGLAGAADPHRYRVSAVLRDRALTGGSAGA
ncbi:MAG TPA: 3-hydroxyacyl-CoA dehydrogenase [Jiangellaceae bacterium]|nr:3-hydroxyacyl-CoA dehydrogenase [Jiangellaceae bacterium]